MPDKSSANADVTVLLSGGIDSAACVAFFLTQRFGVRSLFIDYGQPAADREAVAASAVANHFGVPLRQIQCRGMLPKSGGLIIGRNAFLIFTALMEMAHDTGLLALGVHSGTDYWDCSLEFIREVQSMVDAYTDGSVRVSAPFLEWTKGDIWDFCSRQQFPFQLTYSCELGRNQPCGQCLSCRDLEALHARQKLDA